MAKAAFFTLGCKVNQNDTEAMMSLFCDEGYEIVPFSDEADVYIINTCIVTHLAERKSRQMIRRAVKQNPDAVVGVVGCLSQLKAEELLKMPGINLVLGTQNRNQIVQWVRRAQFSKQPLNAVIKMEGATPFENIVIDDHWERTRVFLKIQEGCSQFCSYCIVPYSRGPARSREPENILTEVRKISAAGFKELVLTGTHLGTYGHDIGTEVNLVSILREICRIDGLERIRLGSIEPMDLTPALIEFVSTEKKICNYFHIPLQHGDDAVLRKMNRPYRSDDFRKLVTQIREKIPHVSLATDVMVGFPGENESHFQNFYGFCQEMAFSRMHVFKYSKREGTPAATFAGQVSPQIKAERSHCLIELGKLMMSDYHHQFEGCIIPLLVEQQKQDNIWEGLTEHYIKVQVAGNDIKKGEIISVKLEKDMGEYMTGKMISRGD